jgi:PKD repeat protein
MQLRYILFALLLITACKKDNESPAADLFYEVSISGYDVTFSNKTTGAVSYRWDFGDSTSSTEENPVHTYPGKGKYVPTLYATTKDGRTSEASTVVYIAKTSPVKLDDNSLADWDEVTDYDFPAGTGETYFKRMKVDYDANYVYLYFEANTKTSNKDIYDIYLDTDGSATTGYTTGGLLEGGYDVLLEGVVVTGPLDAFNHTGDSQEAFSFVPAGISEFYSIGTVVQDGNTQKFEMRISRAKVKNMAATKSFRLGIQVAKNDWSAYIGFIPNEGQPSFLINLE